MKLEHRYQEILNESFRKHFTGWDTASPMDPVKVFAESLSCSLAEVERRQTRFVDTVLDTLPALFAFSPKPAKAPVGWFQLKPNAGLVESKTLGAETSFRFQGDKGVCQVSPTQSIRLAALHDVKFTALGSTIEMKATLKAPTSEIQLTYLPKGRCTSKLKDISCTLTDASTKKTETFFQERLEIHNQTEDFTVNGTLTIKPGKHSGAVQWGTGASEIVIVFTFDDGCPNGELFENLFSCHLFEVAIDSYIGTLAGEPWEELVLEDRVLTPPAQLQLQYPDDHSVTLHRLDIDLLKLRHTDPSRFAHSFFYNASNHSLILPGGALLLGDYTGGTTVYAQELTLAPSIDWLTSDYQGSPGEAAAFIEKIVPLKATSGFVKRESKVDYLKRFYATVRWLSTQQAPTPGILTDELIHQVESADASLHRVEVEVDIDATHKELTIYLLTDAQAAITTDIPTAIPASVGNAVAQVLNRIVPLDYQWKIEPFRNVPISIFYKADIALEEGRIGSLNDSVLSTRFGQHTRDLLSPGALAQGKPQSKARFLDRLKSRMLQPLPDHSHMEASELSRLDALILHPSTSSFGETVSRRAGELLIPMVEIETNWQRNPNESDSVSEERDLSPNGGDSTQTRRSHVGA